MALTSAARVGSTSSASAYRRSIMKTGIETLLMRNPDATGTVRRRPRGTPWPPPRSSRAPSDAVPSRPGPARLHGMSGLDDVDLSLHLSKKEAKKELAAAQERLVHLRLLLGGQIGPREIGPPLCVLFEGWDASGKGGAIQRLVAELDSRHVRVAQFAAPSSDEKRHHFLWRFWPVLPGWGGMAVLDRSWYGRVLVERVEGFAPEEAWRRAYSEIVDLETTLAAEGTILVKFWMHLSPEEQLRRFEKRQNDPYKAWKLTPR